MLEFPSTELSLTERGDADPFGDMEGESLPLATLGTVDSDNFLILSRSRDRRLSMALREVPTSLLLRRTVGLSWAAFR